jgi:hypothetical protein
MAIPSLTLRAVKGSALTFVEADANFQDLANIKVGVSAGGTTSNVALNGATGAPTAITFANSATVQAVNSSGTITFSSNVANNWTANVQANGQYLTNVILVDYKEKIANTGPFTGTVTVDANVAPVQTGAVTGSITINAPITNLAAGESVTLLLYATGNYTLTSNLKFVQGTKTISTTAGNVDALTIFYDGTSYIAGLAKYF